MDKVPLFAQRPNNANAQFADKIILERESPVYNSPSAKSSVVKRAGPLTIFFLLSEQAEPGKERFYWVGEEATKPLGWVPASRAIKWNHRLLLKGATFSQNAPAFLFADLAAAEKALAGASSSAQSERMAEVQSFVKKYPDVLFPIIERREIPAATGKKNLYHVGLINQAETGSVYSTDLEWLIVLNLNSHTKSSINAVRQVMQAAIAANNQTHKLGLRFGLLGWQNATQNQNSAGYSFSRLVSLTKREDNLFESLSEKIALPNTSATKLAETWPDVIWEGIKQTPWAPQSLRTIILIENAADANLEKGQVPAAQLEKVLASASDTQVRFIAVSIQSNRKELNEVHGQLLQQLATGKTAKDYGVFIAAKSADQLKLQLGQTLERELALAKRYVSAIKAPTAANTATAMNLRTMETAWVVAPEPSSLSPFVFATRDELTLYLFNLRTSTTMFSNPMDVLKKVSGQTFSLLFGETLQNVENSVELSKALPFPSELLSTPNLENLTEFERGKLAQTITPKVSRLEAHLENQASWYQSGTGKMQYTLIPLNLIP